MGKLFGVLIFYSIFSSAGIRNIQQLETAISENSIKTVEEVLPLLDADLRTNPLYVYRSRSSQFGSFENPRAILVSWDNFVLTFSGDPKKYGYDRLEMFEFDPRKAKFNFAEVILDGQNVGKIDRNPQRCTACHGNPTRPLWNSYPLWPGLYGAIDDSVYFPGGAVFDGYKSFVPLEEQNFISFQKNISQHPRYKHLIESSKSPKLQREYRSNLKFGQKLFDRYNQFITQLILEDPKLKDFLPALVLGSSCFHPGWKDTLPAEIDTSQAQAMLEEQIAEDVTLYLESEYDRANELALTFGEEVVHATRAQLTYSSYSSPVKQEVIAKYRNFFYQFSAMRIIVEKLAKSSIENWFFTFDRRPQYFNSGSYGQIEIFNWKKLFPGFYSCAEIYDKYKRK